MPHPCCIHEALIDCNYPQGHGHISKKLRLSAPLACTAEVPASSGIAQHPPSPGHALCLEGSKIPPSDPSTQHKADATVQLQAKAAATEPASRNAAVRTLQDTSSSGRAGNVCRLEPPVSQHPSSAAHAARSSPAAGARTRVCELAAGTHGEFAYARPGVDADDMDRCEDSQEGDGNDEPGSSSNSSRKSPAAHSGRHGCVVVGSQALQALRHNGTSPIADKLVGAGCNEHLLLC